MAVWSDRADAGVGAEGWRAEAEDVGRRVGVPVLVAIAALTALTALVGLLITGPLDAVDALDREVAIELVDARTPSLDRATSVGGLPADTVPVAVLWVVAMAAAGWWTRRWEVPVFLLAAVGGEKLTYLASSLIVERPRPPVPPLGHVFATSSFPSGHVASAISLYGGLVVAGLWLDAGRRPPRSPVVVVTSAVAVVVLAAAVALSRTYRGHHYVSDVVWGALLGVVWLWWAWWLVLRPARPPSAPAP